MNKSISAILTKRMSSYVSVFKPYFKRCVVLDSWGDERAYSFTII